MIRSPIGTSLARCPSPTAMKGSGRRHVRRSVDSEFRGGETAAPRLAGRVDVCRHRTAFAKQAQVLPSLKGTSPDHQPAPPSSTGNRPNLGGSPNRSLGGSPNRKDRSQLRTPFRRHHPPMRTPPPTPGDSSPAPGDEPCETGHDPGAAGIREEHLGERPPIRPCTQIEIDPALRMPCGSQPVREHAGRRAPPTFQPDESSWRHPYGWWWQHPRQGTPSRALAGDPRRGARTAANNPNAALHGRHDVSSGKAGPSGLPRPPKPPADLCLNARPPMP